jgi:SNF2 family DNA or RNA helicase
MGICLDKAHINIFYSMDYSLSNYLQAKDRVMGRGQMHDVTNYYMACKGTVDNKIIKTLRNNQDVATAIADKWRWFVDEAD